MLLAAFAAAVGRYADQRTVVIASPVTRRSDPATQLIIGPFMNTVPLRYRPRRRSGPARAGPGGETTVLGALSNQDAPWHHVLAALTAQHGPTARSASVRSRS